MATTYLGSVALEQLDRAQAVVDRHVVAGMDGCCVACGDEQPCPTLRQATAVFPKYGRLPRRRPGLASREGERPGGFGWFAGAKERTA
jgi:hypothetical protein